MGQPSAGKLWTGVHGGSAKSVSVHICATGQACFTGVTCTDEPTEHGYMRKG